ncbi:hypothetical protein Hanom_Chr08g00728071 [Helianthus anomalus]
MLLKIHTLFLLLCLISAQMQQLSANLPEGLIDKPGPDDVFSKVMGNDLNGDAVMYGLGFRVADV